MSTVSRTAEHPARSAAMWTALDPVLHAGSALRVLDVGGGSGTLAVPLAEAGHDVTVVDPSADALATLRRRAETAGVAARVRGLQGDGDLLHEVLRADDTGYDVALCHSVLEVVDDPAVTLREIAGALRPGGVVSVATVNRAGAVLARALGGHPHEARHLLGDRDPAAGPGRPARRRFDPAELLDLVESAGLRADTWRGLAVVVDLLDAATGADRAAVRELELALADRSPYRDVATELHVLATRP